jgi:hypothetical protein
MTNAVLHNREQICLILFPNFGNHELDPDLHTCLGVMDLRFILALEQKCGMASLESNNLLLYWSRKRRNLKTPWCIEEQWQKVMQMNVAGIWDTE